MSKNICLFSSYFLTSEIPYYIKYYLQQLRPFFDEIVFITNDDKILTQNSLGWLTQNVENVLWVKNEGMDFGMWQKAVNQLAIEECTENLALINDSCICFKPLDDYFLWHNASPADVTGMVMSNETSRHLQSYFIVAKQKAIAKIVEFLKVTDFHSTNYKELVQIGEIGLTQHLENKRVKIAAKFDLNGLENENPSLVYCSKLLDKGIPLIKRKLFRYPSKRLIQKGIQLGTPYQVKQFSLQIEAQIGKELTQMLLPKVKFNLAKEIRLQRKKLEFYAIKRMLDFKRIYS